MTTTRTATPRSSEVRFVATRWTVVLSARDPDSPDAATALETLCRAYWYPLYAFVRRLGHGPHDAQDLTQEFFLRLLQKDYLRAVAREKGKFRTFLVLALKRFLANEWDRARAQKRGGGQAILSLDAATAEKRYQSPQMPRVRCGAGYRCSRRAVPALSGRAQPDAGNRSGGPRILVRTAPRSCRGRRTCRCHPLRWRGIFRNWKSSNAWDAGAWELSIKPGSRG